MSTGKAESEWLGSLLILMAAQGGTWHKVPWRMLRNRYMRYDGLKRLLGCMDKTPMILKEQPIVTYIFGGSKPIEELLIGVMDMVHRGLVDRTDEDGETYFAVNDRLLACVQRAEGMIND
jgi:hypothetical protein